MKLTIAPAALIELQEAVDFYTVHANVGLAQAFLAEFERVVSLILISPHEALVAWPDHIDYY